VGRKAARDIQRHPADRHRPNQPAAVPVVCHFPADVSAHGLSTVTPDGPHVERQLHPWRFASLRGALCDLCEDCAFRREKDRRGGPWPATGRTFASQLDSAHRSGHGDTQHPLRNSHRRRSPSALLTRRRAPHRQGGARVRTAGPGCSQVVRNGRLVGEVRPRLSAFRARSSVLKAVVAGSRSGRNGSGLETTAWRRERSSARPVPSLLLLVAVA